MRVMNKRTRTMFPHGGAGILTPWPWPRCVKDERYMRPKTPILYKRVLLYSHFRSRPVWGRGCPRQRLRSPESCRPPGPRSCQLARCPRTLPPPLRRPLCPSWRAGFSPIPTKSGASRASGLICGSWERRQPGPASAASRSLQKIVGAASRAGREHLQGSSPPDIHQRVR